MTRVFNVLALTIAAFLILIQKDADGQLLITGWHGLAGALAIVLIALLREGILAIEEVNRG